MRSSHSELAQALHSSPHGFAETSALSIMDSASLNTHYSGIDNLDDTPLAFAYPQDAAISVDEFARLIDEWFYANEHLLSEASSLLADMTLPAGRGCDIYYYSRPATQPATTPAPPDPIYSYPPIRGYTFLDTLGLTDAPLAPARTSSQATQRNWQSHYILEHVCGAHAFVLRSRLSQYTKFPSESPPSRPALIRSVVFRSDEDGPYVSELL